MDCTRQELDLKETGFFSEIVTSYVEGAPELARYYTHQPGFKGLKNALEARKQFNNDRDALVNGLAEQYRAVPSSATVNNQLELLRSPNTFTITTAHQPNLFTGYLYFVYKILHTVKLAEAAKEQFPEYDFVPVYYMGSEDADLDELGSIFLNGEKLTWHTPQTGAVGKMRPDGLEELISRIGGQISVLPHGKELVEILKACYLGSDSVQAATFKLVHHLFERFGVVVFIPDNPVFKKLMIPVFREDLLSQAASPMVENTIRQMEKDGFKVQAQPREINLFYLEHQTRERIVKEGEGRWHVLNTNIRWNETELLETLHDHPEKFSPNVILRGLMQETVLPNIAFIGGGGELAYWLEYKALFEAFKVPFPVLLLRNSFLLVPDQVREKMEKNGLDLAQLFRPAHEVLANKAVSEARMNLSIEAERAGIAALYEKIGETAAAVDETLLQHVAALQVKALEKLDALQKKIIRAEKRKHHTFARQYEYIKGHLFPNGSLQERTENILPYYAAYGPQILDVVYRNSPVFAEKFQVLTLDS